ncbi:hypothetical protein LX64_04615 [Chitinophaga skermanii]|uniref:Uncharacterized protein n=1 Tax=Chitinophaga skermanii TaxID=331697 RepID=A0A327Q4X5_9BACT|nr:hypothetical protein [Chitinophaga skermanii]RAI99479.1 hypothetical protein LX64_04615 [Chitinophaga skermanii]
MIQIDTKNSLKNWADTLEIAGHNMDIVFIAESVDNYIWFMTNYFQFLVRAGGNEVIHIPGDLIKNAADFVSVINYTIPIGYEFIVDYHAIQDCLFGFETEPMSRYFFWSNSYRMLEENAEEFASLFEILVTTAYCNRNGLSTVKEDGHLYSVNQKNLFFFLNKNMNDLKSLVDKEFLIPSINGQQCKKLDFLFVELI